MTKVSGDLSNGRSAFEHVAAETVPKLCRRVWVEMCSCFLDRPDSAVAILMAFHTADSDMELGQL